MSLTDTILIVDDSSFIVEGLVAILKKRYRTLAVYGGQQCLDVLKTEKPSIIILDIMMEPMDGWETLTHIKENPDTRHIPVLMFSAKKISAQDAEEHRIRIDDFVSKLVTPKKLIESIENVLARQEANKKSIDSWRSAGIEEDRIDDYTTLMTNLEVDMSLLQNMKVQLSLVREDDDKVRTDLDAVITAIEGRILEENLLEEKLSQEIQESVVRNDKAKERAAEGIPKINESRPESLPIEGRADTANQSERSDMDHEINHNTTGNHVPQSNRSQELTVPDTPKIPELTHPSNSLSDSGVHSGLTGSDPYRETSVPRELYRKKLKTNDSAESLSGNPGTEPVFSSSSFFPDEKILPLAEQKLPAISKLRPFSARTLDNKPLAPDASPPQSIGSGTDISPEGKNPYRSGRSSENNRADIRRKRIPVKESPLSSGGFISRILSTIIGVFKRKEK